MFDSTCLQRLVIGATAVLLAACATVPDAERLLSVRGGAVQARAAPCGAAELPPASPPQPLAQPLRLVSWNLHKGEDAGWQADLERFARDRDLLLLQEAVLTAELREVIERAGHRWQMAGAFAYQGTERGVMIAARAEPASVCTLRSFEPLFPVPKSALVARYALAGTAQTLAVANLHGINFTPGLGRFAEQLEAVARELSRHDGPVIFGGDFNTWSDERLAILQRVMQGLRLESVAIEADGRTTVSRRWHLDHVFVRGLAVEHASTLGVRSSDHNPIFVTLRLR